VRHYSLRIGAAALAAALTLGASRATAQTADPARIAAGLDSLAAAALAGGQAAGLSIAVSLGDAPVIAKGYGYVDLEWKVATPDRAIYQIGSVTKQFTSAAVMQLVEAGRIDLDADVTTYLPDYDAQGRKVPVRRLLDHTSGIRSYTSIPEFAAIERRTLPRDTLVKLFSKQPFTFEPGTSESYNNSGYFLLGLIIERVSGQPYASYVKANLFDRAGMKEARYCSETEVVPGMAHGYDMGERGLGHAPDISHSWPYAAGSLCASAADLDAWNRALHGGKILRPATYAEMMRPGALNDGTPLRYAKGIAAADLAGRRAFHHSGDIPGFASHLAYLPESRLSIAVTVNSQGPVRPDAITRSIAELVLGKSPPPRARLKGKAADYVGAYRGRGGMGEDLTVHVVTDSGGRLVLRSPFTHPDAPGTLVYAGGESFELDNGMRLTFFRERGRVARVSVDAIYGLMVLARQP
jgi:CubicO group peptidase (beta-lactamase class C family)